MIRLQEVKAEERELLWNIIQKYLYEMTNSAIGHHPDYTIAEFTIFPSYRRNHHAIDAVHLILSSYHGTWEIKYNEKNVGAKGLWTMVTEQYSPTVYHINEEETVLEFVN